MTADLPYRPCVGVVLANPQGLIFTGERIDTPGAWQMPQGGIDAFKAKDPLDILEVDNTAVRHAQVERLARLRAERDSATVDAALADRLLEKGFHLVSGGTDNHLLLVNVSGKGLTGKDMEELLEHVGITANKNTVPFDQESPFVTSGIRLGTPALTTRGMGPDQMRTIADIMDRAVRKRGDQEALDAAWDLVKDWDAETRDAMRVAASNSGIASAYSCCPK